MKNSMDKKEIIKFFDKCSAHWDDDAIINNDKIKTILDYAKVDKGNRVLDVACGTGIMFDYYLERGVESILGLDISPEMVKLCKKKFEDNDKIDVICADADEFVLENEFDAVMIFNAFPHFINPKQLIENLRKSVKQGGTLTVAHDAGRKTIDGFHKGKASAVSNGLMSENDLKDIFVHAGFENISVLANDEIYIVAGVK